MLQDGACRRAALASEVASCAVESFRADLPRAATRRLELPDRGTHPFFGWDAAVESWAVRRSALVVPPVVPRPVNDLDTSDQLHEQRPYAVVNMVWVTIGTITSAS